MKRQVLAGLGIVHGEAGRAGWLFVHSVFIGLYTSFFFASVNTLLLSSFDDPARILPWAYITAAILGILVVRVLFGRLRRRLADTALLAAYTLFLLVVVGMLTLGAWAIPRGLLPLGGSGVLVIHFLLFAMWTPSLTLLNLEFSGLALRLLDLRQSKRLIALVSSGEVLAAIAGFFLVPVLVPRLGDPLYLLPIASSGLVGVLATLGLIRLRFPKELGGAGSGAAARSAAKRDAATRGVTRGEPYFVLTATLMGLSVLTLYLVDFAFLNQLKTQYGEREAIAGFIGIFFGTIKVVEFLFKTLVSGRLLRYFGVRSGLLILPATLGLCVIAALVVGSTGGTTRLFFLLVALSKLVWMVLRKSIFDPSFKVLYQPLPASERMGFQSTIEGVVRLSGLLLTGLLLLFISRGGPSALLLVALLVPVLAVWLVVVGPLYNEYQKKLREAITGGEAEPLVHAPLDVLGERLKAAGVDASRRILVSLSELEPGTAHQVLDALLRNAGWRLSSLRRAPALQALIRQAAARHYARSIFRGDDYTQSDSVAMMLRDLFFDAELLMARSRSADAEERGQAALAIGMMRKEENSRILKALLWDRDRSVRRTALVAAGQVGAPQLWPRILEHLTEPDYAAEAAAAIETIVTEAEHGERIFDELEILFVSAEKEPSLRLRILRIYNRIHTPLAEQLLVRKLRFPDKAVRRTVLEALIHQGYQADGKTEAVVREAVRTLADDVVWDLAASRDLAGHEASQGVCAELDEELRENRERLFQLLALLYDPQTVGQVRDNLGQGTPENRVYALEILDMLLDEELRRRLLPLVEDGSPAQVLRRLPKTSSCEHLEPEERLSAMVQRNRALINSRTRAQALRALARTTDGTVPDALAAHVFHPDPLLKEVAAREVLRLEEARFEEIYSWLPAEDREHFDRVFGRGRHRTADWGHRSILGRLRLIEGHPALRDLPWSVRRELAQRCEERFLPEGRSWPPETEQGCSISIVFEGGFDPAGPETSEDAEARLEVFGPRLPRRTSVSDTQLIHWNSFRLHELTSDHHDLLVALLGIYEERLDGEDRESPVEARAA